jgi:tripartite-type tricarboxylate transporter receptor subunit TctC
MLMGNWYGMLAPAGVPRDTLAALEAAMVETMKSPQIAARLASGGVRGATGAQGFAVVLERDAAYWGPQLKKLGIQGE